MNITFVSDAIFPYNNSSKEKRLYELSTISVIVGYDAYPEYLHNISEQIQ